MRLQPAFVSGALIGVLGGMIGLGGLHLGIIATAVLILVLVALLLLSAVKVTSTPSHPCGALLRRSRSASG